MVEIKGGDYESVKNMIFKLTRSRYAQVSRHRKDLEFEDLLCEAMCIYSTCLVNFKEGKGMKFSTYLYQNLHARLRDYTKFTMREYDSYEDLNLVGKDGSVKQYEETIVSPNYDLDLNNEDLIESAKEELSYEALQVLRYILSREWEAPRQKTKPTNAHFAKHFGYSMELIESIMYEIKLFWNKTGWMVA